jgi:hypothetical protein
MSKKGGSPPPAPDPVATAKAQGQANKEAIYASANVDSPNLYGPAGSVTYVKNADGVPTAQYTNLTPVGQATFDTQQGIGLTMARNARNIVNSIGAQPFTLDGMPYDPRSYAVNQNFPQFQPQYAPAPRGPGGGFGFGFRPQPGAATGSPGMEQPPAGAAWRGNTQYQQDPNLAPFLMSWLLGQKGPQA